MVLCPMSILSSSRSPYLIVSSSRDPQPATNNDNDNDNDNDSMTSISWHSYSSDVFFLGVDAGTESLRASIISPEGNVVQTHAVSYPTEFPRNGYVEQQPQHWWDNLGTCVRAVLSISDISMTQIKALCIDATCCSVVALDGAGQPLRPSLLWMDARAAECAADILVLGKGDSSLEVNCGGHGPISAEWMLPKALWIKRHEPQVWNNATYICEKLDFLNYRLTGKMCASACNVAARWHFDAQAAVSADMAGLPQAGRPVSLLEKIDLLDVLQKWPQKVLAMGTPIGSLTVAAAAHLGLSPSTLVVQGGPDAYVAMVGLGCIRPGDIALITGSSHLHLRVCTMCESGPPSKTPRDNVSRPAVSTGAHQSSSTEATLTSGATGSLIREGFGSLCSVADDVDSITSRGYWGPYRGAPFLHLNFSEGGQSSTGALLSWARQMLSPCTSFQSSVDSSTDMRMVEYAVLDDEAAGISIGAEGLLVLETLQGARTPCTDPLQRGALVGLNLHHTRAHVWRALLESVCYGTRACLEALMGRDLTITVGSTEGSVQDSIFVTGGALQSPFWLQMHADVTGLPVRSGLNGGSNAALTGCAVLACVGWTKHHTCPTGTDGSSVDNNGGNGSSSSGLGECTSDVELIDNIVSRMVKLGNVVLPDTELHSRYNAIYKDYQMLVPALQPIFHSKRRFEDI